jgi:quinoprotein glucose dehydrogenase
VKQNINYSALAAGFGICILLFTATPAAPQSGAKQGEWPTYGGDPGNTRYPPLDQITADNFNKLQVAWRFSTANLGPCVETSPNELVAYKLP